MRCALTFVLPLLGWLSAVQAQSVDSLISCLKSSLSPQGSVALPSDAVFESDTLRFSTYHAPSFRVVSKVANEHDVRASILCAHQTDTPFLVTGPRHGFYSPFSDFQNGLEILTVAFDEVAIDAELNAMTVGGAVTMQQVTDALYAVGKNIPIGSAPCVGFVGASLGAGIGRLQGLYGTMSDSLRSARIMLPNTTVVEASTDSDADLFWAMRGAGFNLGVVLNATFQIYDAPESQGHNFNADFEFPVNIARSFYQALKDKASSMPAPLCIATNLAWSEIYNRTTLRVNAVYAGPEREGRQAVQFLQHLGPTLRQNFTSVPWNELAQTAFFANGSQDILNCKASAGPRSTMGAAFNVLDVNAHVQMTELFNEMVTRYPQTRLSDNSMYFCANQGVQAVPDNTTAYRWRHALGHQTWGISFPSANGTDASIANLPQQLRETIARSAGTDGLNVYVGFSNGDEPLEAVFSRENLPRLANTKREYDPEGLFNAYHPLPTRYP